jgi:3,4-dihydroxy-2-butanone 4-phosphate synthase
MAFVELENGNWINPDLIEEIFKENQSDTSWKVVLNHGEFTTITDYDRARILKAAGVREYQKYE